jgi:hypothetical protein
MPRDNSEDLTRVVAPDQQVTLTGPALEVSWLEWSGHLDCAANNDMEAVNNDMEDDCSYTWTPARTPARETAPSLGRPSLRQRLAAFGQRLSGATIQKVCAHK